MTRIERYANEIYLDQESSPPPSNIDFIATNKLTERNELEFFKMSYKCYVEQMWI